MTAAPVGITYTLRQYLLLLDLLSMILKVHPHVLMQQRDPLLPLTAAQRAQVVGLCAAMAKG